MSMNTLPDDIVRSEILPLLPLKTLVRFMCVCKPWESFIRDPELLRVRKLLNNLTYHLIFLSSDPEASQLNVYSALHPNTVVATPLRPSLLFTFPDLNSSKTRVKCVNGLLCFHHKTDLWLSSHVDAFTLVANPTTRQVVTLPLDHSIDGMFMVSTHFGYDPVGDQLKVLRLLKYYDGSHEFKVFTLGGGDTSWRVVTPETSFALMHHDLLSDHEKRGLCVNGAIYWRHSTALLVFDVGTEQFRVMPVPSGYSFLEGDVGPLLYPDLVEIDGCLCLVGYSDHDVKLWILRDSEAQRWEQKIIVPPSPIVFPVCKVPTGEILLLPYFIGEANKEVNVTAIYYDMNTMRSRTALIMETPLTWTDDIVLCQESFRLLE